MRNITDLMHNVFTDRMSGPVLNEVQVRTLQGWIDRLPQRAAPRLMDASAARGRELFHDQRVACASCHTGNGGTNNQNSDVGTGSAFQVPTLHGIAWRAPFMHNGCAPTLRDRFTNPACGGGDRHGVTSHLNPGQINDLVAYLETL
jgi:cytochrome c peroxidase